MRSQRSLWERFSSGSFGTIKAGWRTAVGASNTSPRCQPTSSNATIMTWGAFLNNKSVKPTFLMPNGNYGAATRYIFIDGHDIPIILMDEKSELSQSWAVGVNDGKNAHYQVGRRDAGITITPYLTHVTCSSAMRVEEIFRSQSRRWTVPFSTLRVLDSRQLPRRCELLCTLVGAIMPPLLHSHPFSFPDEKERKITSFDIVCCSTLNVEM